MAGIAILSNIVIPNSEVPTRVRTLPAPVPTGTPGKNGVLQMPYVAGHQRRLGSRQEVIPAEANLPVVSLPENNMGPVPDHILTVVDDMERDAIARAEMAASVPTEADMAAPQSGVTSEPPAEEVWKLEEVPPLLTPLSDDRVTKNLSPPIVSKRKRISLSLRKDPSEATASGKWVPVEIEELPSTSARMSDWRSGSLLRKELLKSPQRKTQDITRLPNEEREGLVNSRVETTVTGPVVAAVSPDHRQRGLGAARKRIQIDGAGSHDSDSDSDSEVFSQRQHRDAYKMFKRALADLRKRRSEAMDAVREVDEELEALEVEQRRLDERRRRAMERKTASQRTADSIQKKLAVLSRGLGMNV